MSLWRWLEQAVGRGWVLREGTGRKNAPYRYWLPSREEQWKQDPLYGLKQANQELLQQLDQDFQGHWFPGREEPKGKKK